MSRRTAIPHPADDRTNAPEWMRLAAGVLWQALQDAVDDNAVEWWLASDSASTYIASVTPPGVDPESVRERLIRAAHDRYRGRRPTAVPIDDVPAFEGSAWQQLSLLAAA